MLSGVRVAALDLGSNTFHALIADVDRGGELAVIEKAKRAPRIGEAIFRTGRLSGVAMQKALNAVGELVPVIERNDPHAVLAVATSAVREARNGRAFVNEVRARFGVDVQVISGDAEARLSYAGARARLGGGLGRATLFDLGGGSLEVVVGDRGRILQTASAPMGVLRAMADRPLADPPAPQELQALERWAHRQVEKLLAPLRARDLGEVVLCAGTARALRSVARALDLIPQSGEGSDRLGRDTLGRLIAYLAPLPHAVRRNVPGLEPARADLIVHGAVILAAVLAVTDVPGARVCRAALREGLILEHARRRWPSAAA
jgi:exopolyphosphatase/guanosine-5'-triphosphate,3'-diphosphate pyrophosphatase